MNWKKKLSKPFAEGDIVESKDGTRYKVLTMINGEVTVETEDGFGGPFKAGEEEYFKILKKV